MAYDANGRNVGHTCLLQIQNLNGFNGVFKLLFQLIQDLYAIEGAQIRKLLPRSTELTVVLLEVGVAMLSPVWTEA